MPEQTEHGTRGQLRCSKFTGCGGVWTWGPDGTAPEAWPHSWTSELDARLWADTHVTVCDGPVEVVVTHRDGEPVNGT